MAAGRAPRQEPADVDQLAAQRRCACIACIACGACVAQSPNGAAQLFTSAKVSHLGLVPQGQPERYDRVVQMVAQMESEAFGSCTNHKECEAVCPKEISTNFIARMNRDYLKARLTGGRG